VTRGRNTRRRGNTTVRKIRKELEADGYLTDTVEKHGKFVLHKDLFSSYAEDFGFDIIAIRHGTIKLIQAKTNRCATHTPYSEFAMQHAHSLLHIEQWVWVNNLKTKHPGFVIWNYNHQGVMTKIDERKEIACRKKKKKKKKVRCKR